ncbi:hypothetical protein V2G26_003037 [Clonostachys chloroleuca]
MSFSSSQSSSLGYMSPWDWVFDDSVMAGWGESPYSMPISQPQDELFNVYSSVPLSRGVSSEGSTTNPQSLPASPLSANFDSVQSSPVFGPCFDQSLGHFDFVPDLSLSPGSAPASFPMYPQTLMDIPRTVPYRQSPPTSGILAHSRSIAHNARRARRARPVTRPKGAMPAYRPVATPGPSIATLTSSVTTATATVQRKSARPSHATTRNARATWTHSAVATTSVTTSATTTRRTWRSVASPSPMNGSRDATSHRTGGAASSVSSASTSSRMDSSAPTAKCPATRSDARSASEWLDVIMPFQV